MLMPYFIHQCQQPSQMPTIEITYSPGSNQKPLPPSATTPANGRVGFCQQFYIRGDNSPTIEWTPNNIVPVIGWGLELDTSSQFDSPNKLSQFRHGMILDLTWPTINMNCNRISKLHNKWFWRVRGLSSTYQLGEWSSEFHFYLPDFTVDLVDSDTFTTEISHNSALSNSQVLEFVDLSIFDLPVLKPDNINEPFIEVGTTSTSTNSSMLLKIPIPVDMHPENASVIDAKINLESTPLSATGIPIAVREVLKPWDENANNIQYNATTNWTEFGGRSIGTDISSL